MRPIPKTKTKPYAPKKGDIFEARRTETTKEVIGFTTKPDGIRRARLRDLDTGVVTASKLTTLAKNYVLAN